jgi:hypothetical protein
MRQIARNNSKRKTIKKKYGGGNKNTINKQMKREINETEEMFRGRLEFVKLNQSKNTGKSNNKNNNTQNKNKNKLTFSLEDIILYSKVWLYKTYYHCTYLPAIEKRFQSFISPKISVNH